METGGVWGRWRGGKDTVILEASRACFRCRALKHALTSAERVKEHQLLLQAFLLELARGKLKFSGKLLEEEKPV